MAASPAPACSSPVELDMGTVVASMAGSKRPQDRVLLANMKSQWHKDLAAAFGKNAPSPAVSVETNGHGSKITDGAVVIAAIPSCTNTSNPSVMIWRGLLARNSVDNGVAAKPSVKT